MKTIPYTPITGAEILSLRKALPAIIAWLRARERGAGVSPAIEMSTEK